MISFDMIQEHWFYYAALFCVSFLIGSIKPFSKVWYNIALFVVLVLLEVIVCNLIGLVYLYPTVLSLVVFFILYIERFKTRQSTERR